MFLNNEIDLNELNELNFIISIDESIDHRKFKNMPDIHKVQKYNKLKDKYILVNNMYEPIKTSNSN